MRKILVYLFFLFGCSSVNIDIIQTGPWFPSTKPDKIEIEKFNGLRIKKNEDVSEP